MLNMDAKQGHWMSPYSNRTALTMLVTVERVMAEDSQAIEVSPFHFDQLLAMDALAKDDEGFYGQEVEVGDECDTAIQCRLTNEAWAIACRMSS